MLQKSLKGVKLGRKKTLVNFKFQKIGSLLLPAGDWSKVPSDAPRFVIDMFPCNIVPNIFITSMPQSMDKPFGKPEDEKKNFSISQFSVSNSILNKCCTYLSWFQVGRAWKCVNPSWKRETFLVWNTVIIYI